jgi:heavy metal sensor kinase
MRKLSIGVRLTLWYLVIFALAQFVFGLGMWLLLRNHLYDLADDNLESQLEDLQKFFEAQKKETSVAELQQVLTEAFADHAGDYLQVYAGNGNWIYQSQFMKRHPLPPVEPERITRLSFEDHWINRRPLRFATQRFEVNGHGYAVQTGLHINDLVSVLSAFRIYLLMFAPLALLVAASGGYWLSRRALAPVDAIVRTARQISGANLDSRLEKLHTGDELERLSETLNEMLDRIEGAFRRVTQFTADASHELRTPISLIRTEAELALRRAREGAQYKEALQHILREAERTTALIEELLTLARADSGSESLKMHPLNVREALREVADGWRPVATMCNLEFRDQLEVGDLFVVADESALRRVVNILLDNAFKFTAAPGIVDLSLEQKEDKAVITVRDSGVGIAPEEQPKIFERFYRVDKVRSRETQGAGLGLSIAQWIVQQHGGAIRVESELGKGSAFRVELPCIGVPVPNSLMA